MILLENKIIENTIVCKIINISYDVEYTFLSYNEYILIILLYIKLTVH